MSMTSRAAIKQGFGLARRARSAVWILFFANLGLAALAAWPIYRGILRFTGHSLMSQTLAAGFSVDWLTDLAINSPGSLERYAALISLFGLFSILADSVLAGGVLACFRDPIQRPSLGDFCHDCTRYAWRLVRLMILGLICYWIVFRVLNQSLGNLADKWTRNWLDDRSVFWVKLVPVLLVLLGLGFVNLVMDYARIRLVMEDGPSAVEAFLASLGFSLSRIARAATVYAVPSLCGIALLGLYGLVMAWPPTHALLRGVSRPEIRQPLTVALLFIAQQAITLGRYWFRVATWGSEWSYFRSLKLET